MAHAKPAYRDRIIQDPDIMVGKPVVKGTRIPVTRVLHHLEDNPDLDDLFAAFPRLTLEDVKACLAYARAAVEKQERPAVRRTLARAAAARVCGS
jgi:uncharacterized protein (DUF433 family)